MGKHTWEGWQTSVSDAPDLDPLRGELEKIFERKLSRDSAKPETRGFGVGDSQPGKQSVSADGASPATYATRTAARGRRKGNPSTGANLSRACTSINVPLTEDEPKPAFN